MRFFCELGGLESITAVIISRLPNLANNRAVDMAAEHALDVEPPGVTHDRIFVGADETDRVLDPLLDRFAERPVAKAKEPPDRVYERVEREQELVTEVANEGEPLGILDHGVEFMAMENEKVPSIGGHVNGVLLDRDRTIGAKMAREEFVVIARDVDDSRPFARLAQNFLDDVVMLLRPIDSAPERPDINPVTDNVERIEFVHFEESEQGVRTAASGT